MLFSFEPRMDERKRYFDRFELGVEAYLNGEWEQARALLEGCVNSDSSAKMSSASFCFAYCDAWKPFASTPSNTPYSVKPSDSPWPHSVSSLSLWM